MTALLQVDNVCKRFAALRVVDEFTFDVAEGEALGIVGPNGAGKTTLLNLVAGDLRPDSGTISLAGQDITKLPAHVRCHRGIGRTAQIPRPFEGLTVFENVLVGSTFGSRGRSASTGEQHAVAALSQAGMLDKANLVAGSLTLLDRKRLELARALATQPTLLLLDEIAGGLTEAEVLELVETIKQIRAIGISIVWIEHIVHALLRVVDRMVAVDAGRKLIDGDPHVVMSSTEVRAVYLGEDLAGDDALGST
ncbi:MAG TPA: ABC transporter ATP-binding protein [Ilumatobacteraceae bacterium]|nr:ABC transporter ATP-binding protein [Ilumatobacteraceae bacterium]